MPEHKRLYLITKKRGRGAWLSRHEDAEEGCEIRPVTTADLTPDRVAEFLDLEAESANQHGFVGCHAGLLQAMRNEGFEEPRCRDLFLRLLSEGGLQGLRS